MIAARFRRRSGLFLIDAAFGLVLLAAVGLLIAGLLANLARLRRASDVRQAALHTAANLMDRLAAEPWDDLHPGRRPIEVPPELSAVLPGASAEARITEAEESGLAHLRRVEVVLDWPATATAHRPVRLVTWLGRAGRPAP